MAAARSETKDTELIETEEDKTKEPSNPEAESTGAEKGGKEKEAEEENTVEEEDEREEEDVTSERCQTAKVGIFDVSLYSADVVTDGVQVAIHISTITITSIININIIHVQVATHISNCHRQWAMLTAMFMLFPALAESSGLLFRGTPCSPCTPCSQHTPSCRFASLDCQRLQIPGPLLLPLPCLLHRPIHTSCSRDLFQP